MMDVSAVRPFVIAAVACLCSLASSAEIETLGPRPETVPPDPASPGKGEPRGCFVVYAGVPLLAKPASGADVVGKAEFLKYGLVVRTQQSGDDTYYLLAEPVDRNADPIRVKTLFGWIHRQYCLEFFGNGPESYKDANTSIRRKCILINSITKLPENADSTLLAPEVAFYGRPSLAKEFYRSEHRLFSIYYIYMETETHFFVGNQPNCAKPALREEVLLGWIDKRWSLEWNTREALEFNKRDIAKRTREAIIFSDYASLKTYLETDKIGNVLAREDLRDTRPPEYYELRYPVLYDARTRQDIEGVPIYKIGIIGPVLGPGMKQILSKEEVDRMREDLLHLKETSSKIQVHFVIDATFSMRPWLQAARSAVKEISRGLETIQQGSERKIEYAATVYRDRDAHELMIESTKGFTSGPTPVTDFLEEARAFAGDLPGEPVFLAIKEALQLAPFDNESVKVLVLIGDDGNTSEAGGLDEDQIAKILVDQGGAYPIGFFAISVGLPDATGTQRFQKQTEAVSAILVAAQTKAVAERLQQFSDDPNVARAIESVVGRRLSTREPKEMIEAVQARVQLALTEVDAKRKFIADYASGAKKDSTPVASSDKEQILRVIWESQLDNLLKNKNLDRIKLASNGVQICEEGWTFKYHPGQPVLEGEVEPLAAYRQVDFMHKSEVFELDVVLGSLVQSQQSLDEAWKETLQKQIGEKLDSSRTTPEDIMRKRMGLASRDGLLALTFEEIGRQPPSKRMQIRQHLELAQQQIKDVIKEEEAEYKLEERDGDFYWKRSHDRQRKFWWGEKASATEQVRTADSRAWIPREYLP